MSRRATWLLGSIALVWAIVTIPVLVSTTARESTVILLAQLVCCGIVLGLGRQGFDVLLLRVLASSLSLVVAELSADHGNCHGVQDCLRDVLIGTIVFGGTAAVVMAVVAIPTTILWSRGPTSLRPEFPSWLVIGMTGLLAGALCLSYIVLLLSFGWPP